MADSQSADYALGNSFSDWHQLTDPAEGSCNPCNSPAPSYTAPVTPTPPGMLLHLFPLPSTPMADDTAVVAAHILHWLCIISKGPAPFACAITCNLQNTAMPLALYEMLPAIVKHIKMAHGFHEIILQDASNEMDRCIGFFIGNHFGIKLADGWHLQDPPPLTAIGYTNLLMTFDGQPVTKCILHSTTE